LNREGTGDRGQSTGGGEQKDFEDGSGELQLPLKSGNPELAGQSRDSAPGLMNLLACGFGEMSGKQASHHVSGWEF
jgi:hypothetical protein